MRYFTSESTNGSTAGARPGCRVFVVSYSSSSTLHLKVSSIWECIPKIFERVLNQKSDLGRVLGNSSRVTGGTLRVQCQQFCCQVFWSVEPGCWCRDILLSQICWSYYCKQKPHSHSDFKCQRNPCPKVTARPTNACCWRSLRCQRSISSIEVVKSNSLRCRYDL